MPRIIKMAKGTYTAATITVDGEGRVISGASGSGGGAIGTTYAYNSPGTFTSSNNSIYMMVAISGGGGASGTNPSPNAGNATNFGTFATATGGAKSTSAGGTGASGPATNNLYWAVGYGTTGESVGGDNQGGLLFGSGAGANQTPQFNGGGSGGVDAKYLTEPQYTAGAGIPYTVGTGGTGHGAGGGGKIVIVEYAT